MGARSLSSRSAGHEPLHATRRAAERSAPRTEERGAMARSDARLAYLLLAPAVFAMAFLIVLPIGWNLAIAFQRVSLLDLRNMNIFNPFEIELTLRNFMRVTRGDFWPLVLRTFTYATLGAGLATLVGLWAALALRRPFPGRSLVRALMFVPYVVPLIAATFIWRTILAPQYGTVNAWLAALFDTGRIDFLGARSFTVDAFGMSLTLPMALSMVILFEAWRYFPFAYLFILARLQAVSESLEEAAILDGATVSQRFRYVILPELRGVLVLVFLIRFMSSFNDFSNIYLLTGGSAGTEVVSVQMYEWLVGRGDPGAAAALAMVLAAVLAVTITLYFRLAMRRSVPA
jgi:multiple sugar transport system permease protein